MNIAVLGCGPSGLIATHTAVSLGADVKVFSFKRVKSHITGAQYLHQPIRGINSRHPDRTVTFRKDGNREGYARKVYDDPNAPCSWASFPEGRYPMWSLRDTYDVLWKLYADRVREAFVTPAIVENAVKAYDLVISTIPAHSLCVNPDHNFPAAEVYIRPESPPFVRDGEVWYSGNPLCGWYRASRIDGVGSTEFGHPVDRAVKGFKPLDTDCDCQGEVVRAGRFGLWQKGILLHQTQDIVDTAIMLKRGREAA
jgi:hypothetical protein